MNVFTYDLGVHQGRMPLPNAPDGAFVYELGHAKLADYSVQVGDFHEVSQSFTVTPGARCAYASIVVTTPPVLPAGSAWEVSAWLNGTKMVARRLRPSKRQIALHDWRVSLAAAAASPATNVLAFRLELV